MIDEHKMMDYFLSPKTLMHRNSIFGLKEYNVVVFTNGGMYEIVGHRLFFSMILELKKGSEVLASYRFTKDYWEKTKAKWEVQQETKREVARKAQVKREQAIEEALGRIN